MLLLVASCVVIEEVNDFECINVFMYVRNS